MADIEEQPPPNEFHSRLTSPKQAEQVVGTEMHNHNGGLLAFKVYPKAWGDNDHHERFDMSSPQIDNDDDDDEEDHMISKGNRLKHSINLPPMSPTMLSPPPKYIASQVCLSVCVYQSVPMVPETIKLSGHFLPVKSCVLQTCRDLHNMLKTIEYNWNN